MPGTAFQILRVAAVVAALGGAAALATPPDRIPLALRGVLRVIGRESGAAVPSEPERSVPLWRRITALALALAAAALALA